MLACAPLKDTILTHGHVVTIIAKALNVNLDDFTRVVECSYFTKQAFLRGEAVNSLFCFVQVRTRSCWCGIAHPSQVAESQEMEEEEEEDSEEPPMPRPFGDVPSLTYPLQGEPGGSLSAPPPIWNQLLDNQLAMQHQLNAIEARNL